MKLTIEVDDRRVADLLCSALEGGSNYWYETVKMTKPPKVTFDWRSESAIAAGEKDEVYRHIHWPMSEGGSLSIKVNDGEAADEHVGKTFTLFTLDRPTIERGLSVFASLKPGEGGHHFGDWMAENDDATTGDAFLQCCLFGSIVYG